MYSVQSSRRTQNLLENSLSLFSWTTIILFIFYFVSCCTFFVARFLSLWSVQFPGKCVLNGMIQQVTPCCGTPLYLNYLKSRCFVIPWNLANLNYLHFLLSYFYRVTFERKIWLVRIQQGQIITSTTCAYKIIIIKNKI